MPVVPDRMSPQSRAASSLCPHPTAAAAAAAEMVARFASLCDSSCFFIFACGPLLWHRLSSASRRRREGRVAKLTRHGLGSFLVDCKEHLFQRGESRWCASDMGLASAAPGTQKNLVCGQTRITYLSLDLVSGTSPAAAEGTKIRQRMADNRLSTRHAPVRDDFTRLPLIRTMAYFWRCISTSQTRINTAS